MEPAMDPEEGAYSARPNRVLVGEGARSCRAFVEQSAVCSLQSAISTSAGCCFDPVLLTIAYHG